MLISAAMVAAAVLTIVAMASAGASPATAPASAPAREAGDIAVMTFNIRTLTDHDGPNGWEYRRDMVVEAIRRDAPDLLGTQEVRPAQLAYLKESLKDAYKTVAGMPASALPNGEHQALFIRTGRFEVIEQGQFWLSETPDKPGSRGWDAALPRSAVWARLKDLSPAPAGRTVLFINTHWDHRGDDARRQSGKLMQRWIAAHAGDSAVILTGDFNARAGSPAYENLATSGERGPKLIDAYRAVSEKLKRDEGQTFHGFTGKPNGSGRIDWIFCTRPFMPISAEIDMWNDAGRYPSDHFPVWALLRPAALATEPAE